MGRSIVFFSPKGGVGNTFLSVNTAIALRQHGYKILLVDASFPVTGDIARILSVFPKASLLDMYNNEQYLPLDNISALAGILAEYITKHDTDIDVLSCITRPEEVQHIININPSALVDALKKVYDFIIIDAGKTFSGFLVKLTDHSNLVISVVVPDILSVYQTKAAFATFQSLFFPKELFKLILNRAESKGGVGVAEVKTVLPLDIIAKLPSEGRVVGHSVNFGLPVLLDEPNAKISAAIRNLAEALLAPDIYIDKLPIDDLKAKRRGASQDVLVSFWEEYGFHVEKKFKKQVDELVLLKKRVHNKLIDRMETKKFDFFNLTPEERKKIRQDTERIIGEILSEETGAIVDDYEKRRILVKEIADEALGLGPLEDLLKDPDVTDIMVNNKDQIFIEKFGKLHLADKKFISNEHVIQTIERIISPLGRRIDESVPMVDARLPDGSRVNAIIPPLALNGPMLTIRKFGRERFTADDLIKFGSITEGMASFLQACIASRKNMIVSGGTGSGKTTVLNAFSQYIPSKERIVTIEDAAELRLNQEHWIRLESRPPNIEGKGQITIRDLFRNTLRMRPDRIIIGECRGLESLDMLQAMNTGHDGSLTTIHANSTQDVISRLDSMILMSGIELPVRTIREMVASAIDIIVHTARLSDGSRKVVQVTEVIGMAEDMIGLELRDIFVFIQEEIDKDGKIKGQFSATGYIPSFYESLKRMGIELDPEIFKPKPIFYEIGKQNKK